MRILSMPAKWNFFFRHLPLLFFLAAAPHALGDSFKYVGKAAASTNWNAVANWTNITAGTANSLPGAADDVEINKNYYAGNVVATTPVALASFQYKNGNGTVTFNDTLTVSSGTNPTPFVLSANSGTMSALVVNKGVTVTGNATFGALANGTRQQYWRFTLTNGAFFNASGNLSLSCQTNGSSNSIFKLYSNATVNVGGDFTMDNSGSTNQQLALQYASWNAKVTVGGACTLDGLLDLNLTGAETSTQYVLLNVTSTNAISGSFSNLPFGSIVTNAAGIPYRLKLANIDGGAVNNDIVLTRDLSTFRPHLAGPQILDPNGQRVYLRGINFSDYYSGADDVTRARQLGFNLVRYVLRWHSETDTWDTYDPARPDYGFISAAELARLDAVAQRCAQEKMWLIVECEAKKYYKMNTQVSNYYFFLDQTSNTDTNGTPMLPANDPRNIALFNEWMQFWNFLLLHTRNWDYLLAFGIMSEPGQYITDNAGVAQLYREVLSRLWNNSTNNLGRAQYYIVGPWGYQPRKFDGSDDFRAEAYGDHLIYNFNMLLNTGCYSWPGTDYNGSVLNATDIRGTWLDVAWAFQELLQRQVPFYVDQLGINLGKAGSYIPITNADPYPNIDYSTQPTKDGGFDLHRSGNFNRGVYHGNFYGAAADMIRHAEAYVNSGWCLWEMRSIYDGGGGPTWDTNIASFFQTMNIVDDFKSGTNRMESCVNATFSTPAGSVYRTDTNQDLQLEYKRYGGFDLIELVVQTTLNETQLRSALRFAWAETTAQDFDVFRANWDDGTWRQFTVTKVVRKADDVTTYGSDSLTRPDFDNTITLKIRSNAAAGIATQPADPRLISVRLCPPGRVYELNESYVVMQPAGSWVLNGTAGTNGAIYPAGPVIVTNKGSATFTFTPALYWHVGDVVSNGVSLGSLSQLACRNMRTNAEVRVSFAPDLAPLGTPCEWLAKYGFTNNFAAAELADPDHDGMPMWQEYLADTDPTNASSVLAFKDIQAGSNVLVRFNASTNRVCSLIWSTNLAVGSWTNFPGVSPRLGKGNGDSMQFTNPAPRAFFRLRVQ